MPTETREFDAEGYERRTEAQAIVECPTCHRDVELVAETDGWVQGDDGRWYHDGYGPAMGECCDTVYADWWEGTFAFDLPARPAPGVEAGDAGR